MNYFHNLSTETEIIDIDEGIDLPGKSIANAL